VIGRKNILVALSMIAIMMFSVMANSIGVAQAVLLSQEEHWKYNIGKWAWDSERRRTYGLITPQIVIENETASRLEGFIADANGTRLEMYDGEQIVYVRYMSNNSNSIGSSWQVAGRVHDGYFTIDIPEKYRETEIVRIYIGNHMYVVNDGTRTTPPTEVYINSAAVNYNTNSTLDQMQTEIAHLKPKPLSAYTGGSLLDWILVHNGMLPVRSPDSGK
jgi:hypothetical protein